MAQSFTAHWFIPELFMGPLLNRGNACV